MHPDFVTITKFQIEITIISLINWLHLNDLNDSTHSWILTKHNNHLVLKLPAAFFSVKND